MDDKFLPKLSQNLLEILDDDEYYDVNIEVGNDPYVKIFHAHMAILSYRSPCLRRILSTNKMQNDGILEHIKLPNILPEIFHVVLRYIYGGKLSLKKYDASDIIKILVAASELGLQELIVYIQSFLIDNRANWMMQNFNLTYAISFENDSFLELQKFFTELISKEPEKIFKSIDFNSISEKSLISLIRNDKLQMRKVQIWDHVLKWGIAQNSGLLSDSKSFSKDDFNTLKNTLQQCIPFIEFYDLTSNEFYNNVLPYKKILPKELREVLIDHFLNPKSKKPETRVEKIKEVNPTNIDSNIITFQHAELISKWVDKLNITDEIKNSYKFKLMLQGSRDGFSPRKFHYICDDISNTVTIVKVKDSNEILGGYNPVTWNSNRCGGCYSITKNSFIFSFSDKVNIEVNILSRVKDEDHAIGYWSNCGPTFGAGDLVLCGSRFYNSSYCTKRSYENLVGKASFSVEDYEVFQIIKD